MQNPQDNRHNTVRTQDVAYARGQSHLAYYRALEQRGEIRFITSIADLNACVADWENPSDRTPVGLILSMESADPILDPDQVGEWHAGRVAIRVANAFWRRIRTGMARARRAGCIPLRTALMDALSETDIALDLTHAADLTFWQILAYWKGPVHASHCNCRALVPGQRHLSDDMIRAITDRGGVLGMVFAEQMLSPAWDWDDPRTHYATATRPMRAVLEHIDHICELTGSTDHVAYGTDLDGGFGLELSPTDYHTIADLQRFLSLMRDHGYGEDDIAGFAHGNLIRFFTEAWH